MSDKARVKIGITFASREIDLEVDDVDAFVAEFEEALRGDEPVWWVTDSEGRRHGLIVDKVAYVDIEAERDKKIGFG